MTPAHAYLLMVAFTAVALTAIFITGLAMPPVRHFWRRPNRVRVQHGIYSISVSGYTPDETAEIVRRLRRALTENEGDTP